MSSFDLWIIAVGLAMDCLAVAIASGMILKQPRLRPMLTMAFFFGLFQTIMPLLGWAGANMFHHYIESVDHWIAFFILIFLGLRIIRESLKEERDREPFNPTDFNTVMLLSIATSIDALAVGISFAFLDMNTYADIISPICIIGGVSFVLTIAGFLFGSRYGYGRKIRVELWGGIILMLIGVKALLEHLIMR